jgi:hypothetical protein
MAKQPIITVSREAVEKDIQRQIDKGKDRVAAASRVMGRAIKALDDARQDIEKLVRKAEGYENFTDKQKAKYDSICVAIIEPETQRIGHCKNIIWEWTKPT